MLFPAVCAAFVILCVAVLFTVRDSDTVYVMALEKAAIPEASVTTEVSSEAPAAGLVNINTAGLEELVTLSGIGEVIGNRIIDYRNENGSFLSIDEIMEVKGIGESIFAGIKDFITI